jgi:hypothetical protein
VAVIFLESALMIYAYTDRIPSSWQIAVDRNSEKSQYQIDYPIIDTFSEHNFLVLRLYCKSCKTTHAILPAGTVPYGFYSFSCIMYVLSQYYIDKYSSVKISKKLEISTQMVYLFILKYLLELVSCISFLRAYLSLYIEKDAKPGFVLSIINKTFTEVGFQKNYFINTKQIFLMTRRRNILSRALWVGT